MISSAVFRFYRYVLSPILHAFSALQGVPNAGCRHPLSCGKFAEKIIRRKGWISGFPPAIRRIMGCHPWGGRTRAF